VPDRVPYGARPDIVRCLTSAKTSLNKSADARPGIGRCPSGYLPMCYESNCHKWEATCFCRCTYCIKIDISLLKTKNINTKIYISLEQLRMINMQRTSAIEIFADLSKCGFHHHQCQSQPQSFFILTTCFVGGMMANLDINAFTIAPENSRKIGRATYDVRLISYNAVLHRNEWSLGGPLPKLFKWFWLVA